MGDRAWNTTFFYSLAIRRSETCYGVSELKYNQDLLSHFMNYYVLYSGIMRTGLKL